MTDVDRVRGRIVDELRDIYGDEIGDPFAAPSMRAHKTSVTRGRVDRLCVRLGEEALEEALEACDKEGFPRSKFIDALCLSWFGPIFPRWPRSDRGRWHALPERVWRLTCERCGGGFDASRWDARFCRNACRQAAYRQRGAS